MKVALEQLTYCEYIGTYPLNNGKPHFDTTNPVDQFYKTVHNECFSSALLIVGGLLDPSDKRTISFYNWHNFKSEKKIQLSTLRKKFMKEGLKQIRDEIIAHADIGSEINKFPDVRRKGIIHLSIVYKLIKILNELIDEFQDYTRRFTKPYSKSVFLCSNALLEVKTVMKLAKPKLVDGPVI